VGKTKRRTQSRTERERERDNDKYLYKHRKERKTNRKIDEQIWRANEKEIEILKKIMIRY